MAKTSKIAKAPKSFKSYALNKCLIGYGVVNGIINAAIFAGINAGAPDAMFGMHDIVHDLAFTGLLLGMLLFACVVPLTRMDLRKGVFSLPGAAGGAFPLVSSSYAVSILGVGALAAVVMTGAGALLSLALPAAGATVTGMMFLKGLAVSYTHLDVYKRQDTFTSTSLSTCAASAPQVLASLEKALSLMSVEAVSAAGAT